MIGLQVGLSEQDQAIVDRVVDLTSKTLEDVGWTSWKRRCARGLGLVLMSWGLDDLMGHPRWYIGLPVWIIIAFVAEWGFCGRVRDWLGNEMRLSRRRYRA